MKRFEVLFGVLFLMACEGCASMAKRLRKYSFL
jgi:hypothetical protein